MGEAEVMRWEMQRGQLTVIDLQQYLGRNQQSRSNGPPIDAQSENSSADFSFSLSISSKEGRPHNGENVRSCYVHGIQRDAAPQISISPAQHSSMCPVGHRCSYTFGMGMNAPSEWMCKSSRWDAA